MSRLSHYLCCQALLTSGGYSDMGFVPEVGHGHVFKIENSELWSVLVFEFFYSSRISDTYTRKGGTLMESICASAWDVEL
jgi:hypothetical protein